MANPDSPNGLTPWGDYQAFTLTAGGTMAKGDAFTAASGVCTVYVEGSGNFVYGVALNDTTSGESFEACIDPNAIFEVQCSGTYAATTDDLTTCDIEGGTGEMEANENATVNNTLLILGLSPSQGNAAGEYARVLVKIVKNAQSGVHN